MIEPLLALYDLAQEIGKADARRCAGVGEGTAEVRRRVPACDCEHAGCGSASCSRANRDG